MSIGASVPLMKSDSIEWRRLPLLTALTLLGSVIGAIFLLFVPARSLYIIVPTAMIAVAIFSAVYRKTGAFDKSMQPSPRAEILGYALTFVLGIYGGFYSRGYVTILTMIFVAAFRTSLRDAIATTKLMNVYSSAIATIIFMWRGLVNYKLGIILGLTMFIGSTLGARFVIRVADKWLRRISLTAVLILGLKALFVDMLGTSNGNTPSPAEH